MAEAIRSTVGFRAHTGWAAAVVLAGPADSPQVIDRRRITLTTQTERVHLYHAAAEQPFAKAEVMIAEAVAEVQATTRAAIDALLDSLPQRPTRAAIVTGNARLPDLEHILDSHSLIHSAEGELYRRAIVEACEACELPVTGFAGTTLSDRGAAKLGMTATALRDRLVALGKGLGPPWGQDQKAAALVAWVALTLR